MKAIIIARVSTEEQKEAGNSLPAQIARLERYCKNKEFEIIKHFSFDESAYKSNREEFDQIIEFIVAKNEPLAICCDKVDRLTRNMFDKRVSLLYEKALNDELELHFVSDGQVLTSKISAAEKFQFSISLGLAKYYSDAVRDNVLRAFEQKIRKGEWLAKAPYGYKNIVHPDGTKDIVVDEYEAQMVQKVYELYARGIYSMEMLLKKLKADYGIEWIKSFLDKILKRHFYYGLMEIKGELYPHRYPPIISKELFDQVQTVKSGYSKKRQYRFAGTIPFIYRGLLRCGDCGMAITPEIHKKKHIYYHCTQYKGKHGAKWFKEETITQIMSDIFRRFKIPKDILEQITNTLNEVHQNKIDFHNTQLARLTKEQENITKMMDNLYMDKLKGSITEKEYDRFFQKFCDQRDLNSQRLTQLQEAETNYYITAKYILDLANRAQELFESSEVDEKRQLIKLLLSNVQIKGENIVYDVQKPFDLILESSDEVRWRP
ncbi:recombinase family protein [Candidatus Dependentiae bacterium]